MNPKNILDAEGIKKITDLTAREAIQANDIEREKEKAITKQDVEAREAILALERQQVEVKRKKSFRLLKRTKIVRLLLLVRTKNERTPLRLNVWNVTVV